MSAVHPLYPSENCAETTYHHPATRLPNTLNTRNCSETTDRRPGSMVNSTIRNCSETTYRHPASEVLMIVVWKYVPTTDLFLQSELCWWLACVVAPEPRYQH
ncbi:hypothetical protein IW261DRAFT_1577630 [Armillaria novae-zelandiae]|uniref:Uncharacterized protein n=1 Tax=Armillaria novae-zelandiae TaxID=153914 RepID=A0AA39KJ50_9AGAR|nr:hypothetical protein IW261DRAFT_1577630 [Armillaria novae-zelandiae]